MKEGWEVKKLGDIYDVRDGTHDSPKYIENGFPLITSKNLKNDELTYNGVNYISKLDYENINKRSKVDIGDVLFAMIGTIGNPIVIKDEPNFAIKNVALFKVPENQNSYYLKYYLDSSIVINQMSQDAKGTTQKFVGLGYLRNFSIPIPPLTEQKRIVAILDQAFEAIAKAKANAEQNLKNAKELFESALNEVFENKSEDWEEKKLGDICKINDGTHFSPKNYPIGDYMYITAKNIKPYYIDFSNISYVSKEDHQNIFSRCSPQKGDILYIKDGATTGIATINTIEEEFSMLSSVALLKCTERVLNFFLVHYMNSTIGKKNFLGNIGGAAITRLTLVKLKNVLIQLPPLETQTQIVAKLDRLRAETQKLEANYKKQLEDLEELKKSILQKAFSGELF